MLDLLLRNLVLRLIVILCVILVFPLFVIAITPLLLVVAAFLAWRRRQTFRSAVVDVYASVWDTFCDIIGAPFGHGIR
jgi:hypothetical protein